MAGNGRYELSCASPEPGFVASYPNGQRGNFSGPKLDRSGSFKEVVDSRIFISGISTSRRSGTPSRDLPPLLHSLMLEPIVIGNQKYTPSGELRRVLGFSVGSVMEDNSFGANHFKPSPPVAVEELKLFRASVVDTCIKARGRAKRLEEHLNKLNKYYEAVTSKKHQRNEVTNERSGGPNLKMGTQIQRNSLDRANQKSDDRPKNAVLNKRLRTSMAETRTESQSNGLPRQSLVMAKSRNMLKDSGGDADSHLVEEKSRRMPAGGEGWDKKMKRKRSVGTGITRPVDSDGEFRRPMHHKVNSEPGFQSCNNHGFRSGASNGGSINKLDSTSSFASSNARGMPKNEQEQPTPMRDVIVGLNKDKHLPKGSNKVSNCEDTYVVCPSPVAKGKASIATRTGSMVAANSSPSIPRVAGTFESWEQMPAIGKSSLIGGVNNRRRSMPSGSFSPPMAQWVGQRPQKISRPRRANLMSPVSDHDEMQISSEGCSPPDFSARLTSGGTNASLLSRGVANSFQKLKIKLDDISSPARLSESEESGAVGNRSREKVMGSEVEDNVVNAVHNVSSSAMLMKKNKLLIKEEIADDVQGQGRGGRGSSFSRGSSSAAREKLDTGVQTKPLRSAKPNLDKNGSKSRRPLKKLSNRKGFSHPGHVLSGSPDLAGESDDDHEELLTAANFASNASYLACCSLFWKKMEPLFAYVNLDQASYLLQELKSAEELHGSRSHMFGHGNDVLDDVVHEEISLSDTLSSEKSSQMQNQIESEGSAGLLKSRDQLHDASLFEKLDLKGCSKVIPLYERVLSALIVEDDIEEIEENGMERDELRQSATRNSPYDACILIDAGQQKRERMEFDHESLSGAQAQRYGTMRRSFSFHGNTTFNTSPNSHNSLCNDELLQRGTGCVHTKVEVLAGFAINGLDGPQSLHTNHFDISSYDCQYEQMCLDDRCLLELHGVGLYPEIVPNLDDREDGVIDQEILQLKKGLYQQIGKKKKCLDKIYKAIQEGRNVERREREQVAMDRLVELAYKKYLATRGSLASRSGIPKVSKQIALAFAKRTLARCRKFEESGTSSFAEPVLQEIISAPPQANEAEPMTSCGLAVANDSFPGSDNKGLLGTFETSVRQSDQAFIKSGPLSNRSKKKEVLLDEVAGGAGLRATPTLGSTILGGTKGKRSERERDMDMSTRNTVAKAGRLSLVNYKVERKTKTKPKQKTAQLSAGKFTAPTHPVQFSASVSGEILQTSGNREGDFGLLSRNVALDLSKEIKEPMDFGNLHNELDPIEGLGVGTDLVGHQDLSSWLNFDEDGLQDHDSFGLEIPMDDLSELNMF